MITNIVTGLQRPSQIRIHNGIRRLRRSPHNDLNILLGKQVLRTGPHAARNDDVDTLLAQPSRKHTRFMGRRCVHCAVNNGLYRSYDGAESWEEILSGHIDDIEFKPGDPNTIYAITKKFYKSTDGGDSFTQMIPDLFGVFLYVF